MVKRNQCLLLEVDGMIIVLSGYLQIQFKVGMLLTVLYKRCKDKKEAHSSASESAAEVVTEQ